LGGFSLTLCTFVLEYGFADADEVDVLRAFNLADFEAHSLELVGIAKSAMQGEIPLRPPKVDEKVLKILA
jgi:hypothetical protein